MDIVSRLQQLGFSSVVVLDGAECGVDAPSLLLAIMIYQPQLCPAGSGAHIHPYYFASQKAYLSAMQAVREAQDVGIGLVSRDDIRVKPIFARLPGFTQGRNTISYIPEAGSRFHVQIFTLDQALTPTHHLQHEVHGLHCGSCTRCMERCPTHAIDEEGFHRERCIRNWQLSGKAVPQVVRSSMGTRLIGCDECQRCCPHNPPTEQPGNVVPLQQILADPRGAAESLKTQIGANLALPNRVLSQVMLLAGCSEDAGLITAVEGFTSHPSPVVAQHALWALNRLKGGVSHEES